MICAIVTLPARLAAYELFQKAHGRGDFRCPGIPKSEDELLTRVRPGAGERQRREPQSVPGRLRRGRGIAQRPASEERQVHAGFCSYQLEGIAELAIDDLDQNASPLLVQTAHSPDVRPSIISNPTGRNRTEWPCRAPPSDR